MKHIKRAVSVVLLILLLMTALFGCSAQEESTTLPDFETATYAVLVGSTSEKYVEDSFPNATRLPFDSVSDAVTALEAGKADYVVSAYTNCLNFVRANKDLLALLPDKLTDEKSAIAINKSENQLLNGINQVLQQFIDDGTLDEIIGNWIHDDGSDYIQNEIPVLQDAPVLKVAVSAEREPMCFVQDGKVVGVDSELIQRIAYELGMRVEFYDMKFSAMIPSVLSGKTPVAISNITPTDERRESVNFSTEYFTNPQVRLTLAKYVSTNTTTQSYTTLDELNGKRVGIISGSIFDSFATEQWANPELMYYDSFPSLIVALQRNMIDVFICDQPVARQAVSTMGGLAILDESLAPDEYGLAFPKTDEGTSLRDEFNKFMLQEENGKLLDILDEIWFGTDESVKTTEPADSLPATNGTIRFASPMTLAPFDYIKDDQPVGLEIDLITRFCKKMRYGLTIDTITFEGLLPGLVAGRYDAVAGSISITEERAKSVNFSEPFYHGGIVAVVLGNTSGNDGAVAPETARIGSITGTSCETAVLEVYPNSTYSSFTEIGSLMTALKSGQLDYACCDDVDAYNYTRSDSQYQSYGGSIRDSGYNIAVQKDNTDLLEDIDALLTQYKQDGTLDKIRSNWFPSDDSDYIQDDIPELTDAPVLNVAVCAMFEPMVFYKNNELVGFDVELAKRIAYDLGMRAEFTDYTFTALIPALQSGQSYIVVSAMSETAERAESVNFTQQYFSHGITLMRYVQAEEAAPNFFTSLANSFNKNFIVENRWELIVDGIGVTLLLSVCSGIVGIIFGFAFCLLRMGRTKLLGKTTIVITRILQGTPMVVLLMIFYYIIFNKTGLDGIAVSIIAFGLNFGAYTSEIMLSGINAIDNGQREAAAAIGFTPAKTFIKIIFPQAARHFLPVLKGEYISLVKMTSIVGYVAVQDLTKMSDIIRSRTYEAFFPLIVTAIIYFFLSFGLSSLLRLIEVRIDPKHRARSLKGVKMQ